MTRTPVELRRAAVITLDAFGTLVTLEPPAPLLAAGLRDRGVDVDERAAAAAIAAEIAHYRANHQIAADAQSLARLRARCTEVVRDSLTASGVDVGALSPAELQDVLLRALRFVAYDEVPGALRALRDAGHRLVVVSNWDVSLHEMLRTSGLRELVDGAISSAEAGTAKPGIRIFGRALELAGAAGEAAMHVGDSLEHDVAGALAAGMRPVLVVRAGRAPAVPSGVAVIRSLAELPALAA